MIINRIREKIIQTVKNISKMRVRTSGALGRRTGKHAGRSSWMQAGVEENTLLGSSDGGACVTLSEPDGSDNSQSLLEVHEAVRMRNKSVHLAI